MTTSVCSGRRAFRSASTRGVLMVGGSTRIPAVYDAVKKELGCEPIKGITPMSALRSAPHQGGVRRATSRVCWDRYPPDPGH